jgi:hypothetical protein
MRFARWSLFLAATLVILAFQAEARIQHIRWTHENVAGDPGAEVPIPAVGGFIVYSGITSGTYGLGVWLPIFTPVFDPELGEDVYHYDLAIPDTQNIYVALKAYDAANETNLSSFSVNENMYPGLPGKPGKPYILAAATPPPVSTPTEVPTPTSTSVPGIEALIVGVTGNTITSLVTAGTGPYEFLFDCGLNGNWNGIYPTASPTATHACPDGSGQAKAWVWDQGSNFQTEEIVTLSN